MQIVQETTFLGANRKLEPRFLEPGVGVNSINQKPAERGLLEPWRQPLTISGPNIPAGRKTIYRMGRDTASKTNYWLSWTTIVHAIRGFEASDPTERTYFTGSGSPKWTDNIIGLASAPYPAATRELSVPAPTVAPVVVMNTDGLTGEARQLYYVYTRVNDIGWESAPSPPFLAPLAKPGATLDLSYSEAVPAGNYGIDRVRWYRQQVAAGSTVAEYFFLREYAIGASGQMDDARELGNQLATEGWTPLDSSATWLTKCWNQFAAALVGKSVRTCVANFIYAWPQIDYQYPLNSTPLALASFAQRLVAFTSAGAEVFTGTDPDALDQKQLGLPVISSTRSLAVADNWCAWAAEDGLWYYGVDGIRNLVGECLTAEQWKALDPSSMRGYLLPIGKRLLYIGFCTNATGTVGFVVDPGNPLGFYPLDAAYETAFYDPLLRRLFVHNAGVLSEWDAGASTMTVTWTGKINRQQQHAEGEWLELMANGPATVKVFTEDPETTNDTTPLVERMSRSLTRGLHRIPDGIGGRDWQVQIITTGSVQALAID